MKPKKPRDPRTNPARHTTLKQMLYRYPFKSVYGFLSNGTPATLESLARYPPPAGLHVCVPPGDDGADGLESVDESAAAISSWLRAGDAVLLMCRSKEVRDAIKRRVVIPNSPTAT